MDGSGKSAESLEDKNDEIRKSMREIYENLPNEFKEIVERMKRYLDELLEKKGKISEEEYIKERNRCYLKIYDELTKLSEIGNVYSEVWEKIEKIDKTDKERGKKILRILQEALSKLESERKKIEKIREYDRKIKELYEKEKILLQFADAFCMCITSGRIEDAEKLLKEGEFKIEGIEINQLVPRSKMDPEIFKRKVQNLVNKINSKIENIEKKKAALMEMTDIPKHISERRRFVEKLQHRV